MGNCCCYWLIRLGVICSMTLQITSSSSSMAEFLSFLKSSTTTNAEEMSREYVRRILNYSESISQLDISRRNILRSSFWKGLVHKWIPFPVFLQNYVIIKLHDCLAFLTNLRSYHKRSFSPLQCYLLPSQKLHHLLNIFRVDSLPHSWRKYCVIVNQAL